MEHSSPLNESNANATLKDFPAKDDQDEHADVRTQTLPSIALKISTLTDCFEISMPATATIAHLRAKLESEKLAGTVSIFTEDGKALRDNSNVAELAEKPNLVCVVSTIGSLEARFGELESPGCDYQKYLRMYKGLPASDPRILQSLWALAALSGCKSDPDMVVDQVGAAVVMLLDAIWSGSAKDEDVNFDLVRNCRLTEDLERIIVRCSSASLKHSLVAHYSADAHSRLLSWMLEIPSVDESCEKGSESPKLRLALAEINQVLIRSAQGLIEGDFNPRQIGSYSELLNIANCSATNFWA